MTRELVLSYKRNIERRTGLQLELLPYLPIHEIGKTYYCGYWQQTYIVLNVQQTNDWMGTAITVLWDDGRITTHCTALSADKDFLVIE